MNTSFLEVPPTQFANTRQRWRGARAPSPRPCAPSQAITPPARTPHPASGQSPSQAIPACRSNSRPSRPKQWSHRIDNEEFWGQQCFLDFEAAAAALPHWERTDNVDRFSLALHGDTPAEKLARRLPDAKIA
jgi:hypothetical protein